MKTLPSGLLFEKNKLTTNTVWLHLLTITLPDTTIVRLVNNTEDVVFSGNTYVAFPFEVDTQTENSSGELSTLTIRVSNVSRALVPFLNESSGIIGSVVELTLVNSAYLSEDYSELTVVFDIIETTLDEQWVTFTLGAPNPIKTKFPQQIYIARHCAWKFKSVECGYVGDITTCSQTITACRERNNSLRFGGFMGLSDKGIRLV